MAKNKRVSQKKIEEIKAFVMDQADDILCKMMLLRIIQATQGLTISARAVIKAPDSEEFPEAIMSFRRIKDDLNEEVHRLCLGRFRWSHCEGSYIIWFDADGHTDNFFHVEKEVGYFRGEKWRLDVHLGDGLPEGVHELELNTESGSLTRPQRLPADVSIITAMMLRDLMPELEVRVSSRAIELHEDEVKKAVAFLLQTPEEQQLLREAKP